MCNYHKYCFSCLQRTFPSTRCVSDKLMFLTWLVVLNFTFEKIGILVLNITCRHIYILLPGWRMLISDRYYFQQSSFSRLQKQCKVLTAVVLKRSFFLRCHQHIVRNTEINTPILTWVTIIEPNSSCRVMILSLKDRRLRPSGGRLTA